MGGRLCISLLLVVAACGDDGGPTLVDGVFTEAEWDKLAAFTPLGAPPASPTNRYADDTEVAAFGQKLFFDKRGAGPILVADDGTNGGLGQLGETGKVSCVVCHDPNAYFTDTRPTNKLSLGTSWTGRNAPSLVNVAFYEWGNWAGAHDSFWKQGANGVESKDNFNGNRLGYVHMLYATYRADYDALFPIPLDPALDPSHPDAARFPPTGKPKSSGAPDGAWEMMDPADQLIVNTIMANCGKAYEAYERKLVSGNAPFDRYVGGDYTALSASAKRGLQLFIGKAACDGCHSDTTFTDNLFHNTGVMQSRDPGELDDGRFLDLPKAVNNTFNGASVFSDDPVAGAAKLAGLTATDDLKGKFRTKSLRHVTETAPFMHDGSLATLEDVVRFYNAGGHPSGFPGTKDPLMVPLNLSEAEIADLVAFLEALTGEPVPAEWTVDTSVPETLPAMQAP